MRPLIVVNFKAYAEATGESALKLAKICDRVAKENESKQDKSNTEIILAVQPVDMLAISKAVNIPIYTQHIDPVEPGAFTGHITSQSIKLAGASGSLLNHSERPMGLGKIEKCMDLLRTAGLKSIICVTDIGMCRDVLSLNSKPDFIAYEPPELIGGDVSISSAKPELIKEFVRMLDGTGIGSLVGAGVKTKDDFKKCLDLGARGVLIASGIVKAKDPEKACKNFFSL